MCVCLTKVPFSRDLLSRRFLLSLSQHYIYLSLSRALLHGARVRVLGRVNALVGCVHSWIFSLFFKHLFTRYVLQTILRHILLTVLRTRWGFCIIVYFIFGNNINIMYVDMLLCRMVRKTFNTSKNLDPFFLRMFYSI